ncbi:MAG: cofactor-independent phosphoglycerate mutase [Nitrospirota bacterium]|nr:MAG: cofactor-independent phosphoglycerate mutase [Nitrospirota bacterium]
MKYIVIIGDGMADRPVESIGGITPLKKAKTPNMDLIASRGTVGRVRTIPDGLPAGSDVANLSILGYAPSVYYSGRAPLEAASMGIELESSDVAFRCNTVTLNMNGDWPEYIMEDYSAGHISSDESREIMLSVGKAIGTESIRFYPGISYRHLMVWKDGNDKVDCVPPHDILGESIGEHMIKGEGSDSLNELIKRSWKVLDGHKINEDRKAAGKNPANSIWLWGQGRKPALPGYKEKYGITGALISAVDLTKGLGVYAGFDIIDVPGATGYIDTNYKGKAEYSLKALEDHDFVYLHIEAPDEAGHNGNLDDKIRAIEDIDELVVGPIVAALPKMFGEFRLLFMPDHATPLSVRTHTDDPVPFVIYDGKVSADIGISGYDEDIIDNERALAFEEGHELMDHFIKD